MDALKRVLDNHVIQWRYDNHMAKVLVQTFGGTVKTVDATSPASIAEQLGISVENATITVNSDKVALDSDLRDDDFVSFTTSKVTSG